MKKLFFIALISLFSVAAMQAGITERRMQEKIDYLKRNTINRLEYDASSLESKVKKLEQQVTELQSLTNFFQLVLICQEQKHRSLFTTLSPQCQEALKKLEQTPYSAVPNTSKSRFSCVQDRGRG
jgi:hypothetical protein